VLSGIRRHFPGARAFTFLGLTFMGLAILRVSVEPFAGQADAARWTSGGDLLALAFAVVSLGLVFPLTGLRPKAPGQAPAPRWAAGLLAAAIAGLLAWIALLIRQTETTVHFADMMPIMETMARRLNAGEDPYAPIASIWNGVRPIYLPAFWMPFSAPLALGLDPRWWTWSLLTACLMLLGCQTRHAEGSGLLRLLPLWALLAATAFAYPGFYTQIPELVPIGWYALMLWVLLHRPRSIAFPLLLTACLLSRYACLLWLPTLAWYLYTRQGVRGLGRFALVAGLSGIALMAFSGALAHLPHLASIPNQYYIDIGNPEKAPVYASLLYEHLGLIRFFYPDHLALNRWAQWLQIPWSLAVYHLALRTTRDPERALGLALYAQLALFYNLLVGPYPYLFFHLPFLATILAFTPGPGVSSASFGRRR
jgi:hypothetical protein